jgi:UDP-N-acetylmuramyl pentapeptide phosphotransferase/UDP-N-acetylglucosamine-1-phosphate transferase
MSYFVVAFLLSFLTTMWLLHSHHLHSHISHDHDLSGPQKFHENPVPRIGGVGIAVGLAGFAILALLRNHPQASLLTTLLICALPAFFAGVLEDITKRVSPMWRLLSTAVSAILASILLKATIDRLDIWGLDALMSISVVGIVFTAFCVAGIANAVNIIDGFNGLSSVVVCTMLLSLVYVAFSVNDSMVLSCSLALIGAIIGFFLWNYPSGNIFLGDGGAYLIGFLVADLAVILVNRHPSVSAWYPVLLFMYPLVETLFSIYRRRFIKKQAASVPDGVHLHSLLYRRMIRWTLGFQHISAEQRNAMTSPYLWVLSSMAVVPATLFAQHTWVLIAFSLLFIFSYVWIYWRLVRFKSPMWLNWLYSHRKK